MPKRKTILLVSSAAAVAVVLRFMPSPEASLPEAATLQPVAAVAVARADLSRDVTLSAEFRPYQQADLHAKEAGYLKTITVDIGDQVKAGQVIATLDIGELKDDLARTTAAYHDAKLSFDRVSAVIRKQPGLLAQEEVDNARAAYEMAKANMEKARTLLEYATITVPFDGIVTKRYVDPGALVQAAANSSTQALPIVHIAENTRLRLDFPVPESVVPDVRPGTPVTVTVQATGQVIHTTVARTTGKIDSSTRTMTTELDIDNADLRITPGMYASVDVQLERKNAVLALPVQAVSENGLPNVWVIDGQGKIEQRDVTLGLQTPDKVEITSGIKEGDRVVFGNRGNLSIGMKVRPKLIDAQPAQQG